MGPIELWNPGQGRVTTWTASKQTREALRSAPVDPLPPSAQQAQHLWTAHYGAAAGRDLPRLMVAAWDMAGVCDLDAMTHSINTHVRRHDTYRSSFEVIDGGSIRRRTVGGPESIELVPAARGFMTAEQVRTHALTSTPGTLAGDCFTFGVVQNADHFSVYASVDHLHIDGISAAVIFLDINLTYQALIHGLPDALPPISGYRGHTARQQEQIAATDLESPEIAGWIDFARDGAWPEFPLALGDTSASSRGAWVMVELLDEQQTRAFDSACRAAGARFSGGVMACAALAEHHLTGNPVFHGFTASDTRSGEGESLSVGWYAGLFPVTVPIPETRPGFGEAARAAQISFDANRALAAVPFSRVLELASADELGISLPSAPPMMVSYMDFRKIRFAGLWEGSNLGLYGDNLSMGGINLWINRHLDQTTVTVSFPDNPEARRSVHRYLAALSTAFAGAAAVTADWIDELNHHANVSSRCAVCAGSR